MKHLRFYFEHSLRDMTRNGRRTLFALFGVAAGVAAIVALRTLALSIGDTLTTNVAVNMHGDMQVLPRGASSNYQTTASQGGCCVFTDEGVKAITTWATEHKIQVTGTSTTSSIQIAAQDGNNTGRPAFLIQSIFIDPKVYPFYQTATTLDPPGAPLAQLLSEPNGVIVSKNLADTEKLKVGDQVHVGRTTQLFTVRGIVTADVEGSGSILTLFFGFAYFDKSAYTTLQIDPRPDVLYLKIPAGANVNDEFDSLHASVSGLGRIITTTQTLKNNQQISDIIDRVIVTMGLLALLIGATGIIHTMLVVVRRRTVEIAVLKTLGVKGGQITLLFLVESILMGVVGSILGVLLGILMSGAVLSLGQRIWSQTLQWRVYPQAISMGLEFGIIVTAVFGFLPTLTAAQVRPATVLRPNEARPPTSGCLQIGLALIVVVLGVGVIVGQLLPVGGVVLGIIGVALSLLGLGVLVGLMWVLVFIISKLPTFGSVDLRLALRGISANRFRTASTLLALTMGMFALSGIILISTSIPALLTFGFQNVLGGNVAVFLPIPILRPLVNGVLNTQTGVQHYTPLSLYTGQLMAVNGDTNYASRLTQSGILAAQLPTAQPGKRLPTGDFNSTSFTQLAQGLLSGQDVSTKNYLAGVAIAGRTLNAGDAGKNVVVLRDSDFIHQLNIKPGDKMSYTFGKASAVYTVVGILQGQTNGSVVDIGAIFGVGSVPTDALPAGVSATLNFIIAQVDDAHLNNVLVALSVIPGTYSLDIGFIDLFVKKLLDQFTTIPGIVAVLSLFAIAVIIANTVSLATLERRREIGIMKAIGQKNWRALWVLILENGMVGLLGGLMGIGIGVIVTLFIAAQANIPITQSVSWGSMAALMALSLGIALGATLLSGWSAVTEKPLNVLRYE